MKNQTSGNKTRLAKIFLTEITSNINKNEVLDTLMEILENTPDPDPSELYLLESLYQLKEKIKMAESRINSFLESKRETPLGNKLSDLYNSSISSGSSKFFNY